MWTGQDILKLKKKKKTRGAFGYEPETKRLFSHSSTTQSSKVKPSFLEEDKSKLTHALRKIPQSQYMQ